MRYRFLFPVAAVVIAACGSASQVTQGAPVSSTAKTDAAATPGSLLTSTSQAPSDAIYNTIVVKAAEQISSLPFEIGPMPNGISPRLTVADAFDAIARSLDARFFASDADRSTAVVKVGYLADKGGTEDGSANPQSEFPGYVIEGGHSTCTPSGPPRSDGGRSDPIPCHALVVVNGNTGEMPRLGEISDPADTLNSSGG